MTTKEFIKDICKRNDLQLSRYEMTRSEIYHAEKLVKSGQMRKATHMGTVYVYYWYVGEIID